MAAAQRLGARHSLVFIASDFHFPLATLARVLPMLASHTVVPLVLVDAAEQTLPRGRGLVRVNDMESGSERTLWLRPGLAARLAEQAAARREQFDALCHRHGCPPLHMVDRFDADAVTRYFYQ